jgi:formylglycine-generating enzyme required for sulfatase activity
VVLVVHSDLPSPRIAGRLRIDLYDTDGRWFLSRDLARPNADDWPVSFSVYSEDPSPKHVWVRLRVYPEGKVRDYLGERFQDWPEVLSPDADGSGLPRLLVDGVDETPVTEPDPLLTVDRLLLLQIPREQRVYVGVTLRGACAGTMPSFGQGPISGEAHSCVTVAQQREVVTAEPLSPAPPAIDKTPWLEMSCEGSAVPGPLCIAGNVMVFGNRFLAFGDFTDAAPERLVGIPRFRMDAEEVTVGRLRDALRRGFVPPDPVTPFDEPLSPAQGACTFTSAPGDREDYPLTCVTWATARAFCVFEGGDLPTEAQWELAATQEGRDVKTPYPWGQDDPACGEVVFGRAELAGIEGYCAQNGWGPVALGEQDARDVSPSGLRGLAGGVSEWVRDAGEGYEHPCRATSVVNPWCDLAGAANRVVRGGAWASPPPTLVGTFRFTRPASTRSDFVGFRCVTEGGP